jgi:DNA-directed RNA polymerase subunit K/omega
MTPTPHDSEVKEAMDSKFRYVLVVAERAEQLLRGARAKLDLPNAKPTRVAQEEIDREMVEWDYGPAPQPELELNLEAAGEEGEETVEAAAESAEEAENEEEVH